MSISATTLIKSLLNLVYPLRCASCKKHMDPLDDRGVCGCCLEEIKKNPKPYCESCGRSLPDQETTCWECKKVSFAFTQAHSACLYEGALKELIHQFKYNNRIALAKTLAPLLSDFIKENGDIIDGIDTITFVPLAPDRSRKRGYNQSQILAYNISREYAIPHAELLKKTRSTKPQNALSRNERLVNLEGAFRSRKGRDLEEKRILLVDDVMTTGATLNECSKVLLDGGAKEVRCLTLARGI